MLRFSVYLAAAAAVALTAGAAGAQTLDEALASAYRTNPQIQAQRSQLRSTDEELAQARALILPNVEASATIGRTYTEGLSLFEFGEGDPVRTPIPGRSSTPKTYGLTASQPIWRGGLFPGALGQVRASIGRESETLRATEQSVLLSTVAAYMDVRRAEEVVQIRMNNVEVLTNQQRAASDRFELGEVTRTDVAQADSRLALARSELSTAQADLQQQRAAFERIVGFPPASLAEPPAVPPLPETLDEATQAALNYNPNLAAAAFSVEAAEENIRVARSDLLPNVTVDASLNRREDSNFAGDYTQGYSVTANLRVPLFSGGQQQSEVRQAKHQAEQARHQRAQVRRETIEQVTAAWTAYLAAEAVVRSSESGVEASRLAFEGVEREAEVGLRTTLDVLDAEQEALTARVQLASAQRDAYVAAHQLLSAMGVLTVETLGVPVAVYDTTPDRGSLLEQMFGTGID